MLPRPTAEPIAAKMNAERPEKAPRSAVAVCAGASGVVEEDMREPFGRAWKDWDGPG